jgi:hypothetical protein
MAIYKGYVLFIVSATLIGTASAGGKNVNGLSFRPSPQPKVPCLFQPFQIWQQPDPFFKNLKQVKSKGTVQYRRGRDVVENFPDSTNITVEFWQGVREFDACNPLPRFDPAKVKFHLEWKHDSQVVPAEGSFVVSEEPPQTWCEDRCSRHWTYELRIDSQNVPLQDSLVIRIEAEDGARLAEYIGKLGTDGLPPPQFLTVAAAP